MRATGARGHLARRRGGFSRQANQRCKPCSQDASADPLRRRCAAERRNVRKMYDGSARRPERTIVSAQGCHGARRAAMWSERRLERQLRWYAGSGVPLRARTQRVRRRINPSTEGMESSRTGFRPQAGAFEDHDRVARKSVLAHAGQ